MAKTQFAVQMGMGTDLKGQDYTKAAALAEGRFVEQGPVSAISLVNSKSVTLGVTSNTLV